MIEHLVSAFHSAPSLPIRASSKLVSLLKYGSVRDVERAPITQMRPATTHRIWWTQGLSLCQLPWPPLPRRYQSLYVLSGGDQQRFDVYLLRPPEPEPPHTPCQSLASPNNGSTHTRLLRSAFS
jgi:hypothetical protein